MLCIFKKGYRNLLNKSFENHKVDQMVILIDFLFWFLVFVVFFF